MAVVVPRDAYLNSLGRGWQCNRGYEKADGECAKIEVPSNAFLHSNGNEWKCARGYRKTNGACVGIVRLHDLVRIGL